MNVEFLRKKMNDYFKKVTPEELLQQFEKMGYKFKKKKKRKIWNIRK